MRHRKRDTTSGISSNRSYIARAMRIRMPKVPPNLAPPETSFEPEAIFAPQVTTLQLIIARLPTNQPKEIMIPPTPAPLEALHQVRPRRKKGQEKVQNILNSKTMIHPVNQQSHVRLIQHSPAKNVVLVMSNRYNLLWYKLFLIQQPKQRQSLFRSPRQS